MAAATDREPHRPELRRLDGPEHGQRRVAGEEEVVAHFVGHEQRRETRVPPNDAGRRWQRAKTLAELPQAEHDEHGEKRRKRRAEDRRANQGEADEINENRAGDQRGVGGPAFVAK